MTINASGFDALKEAEAQNINSMNELTKELPVLKADEAFAWNTYLAVRNCDA